MWTQNCRENWFMKIIFLDVDGVLNGIAHNDWTKDNPEPTIWPSCVKQLSIILRDTTAKLVISSAWRGMIINEGAMTLRGFEYLLKTHGIQNIIGRIVGTTRKDINQSDFGERKHQISEWLNDHPEVTRYVVVDDNDHGISSLHPLVLTQENIGLTEVETAQILKILGKN